MKKRMFTISIIAALSIGATFFIFSRGFFSANANAVETYTAYEKDLSKLFLKYSDTMTAEELATWQNEVDEAADKAANALIRIQEDPDDWRDYLASTGQPYRPSPFAPLEFTGLAAKSPNEVTSDEFDEWYEARDKQREDRRRAEMRAEGIWDDATIEEMIAKTNESLANDPEIQETREKMRQVIIWNENYARRKADRDRRAAENQARREKDNAWRAAEQKKIDKMLSEGSEAPSESGVPEAGEFDTFETFDGDFNPPSEALEFPTASDDDMDTRDVGDISQPPPLAQDDASLLPQDDAFSPDAFASMFSEDMSFWEDTLQESYQDVFDLDASFEEGLPEPARQIFNQRRQRLQSEYVSRIDDVLRDVPKSERAETLRIVRERLSETWDSDFTDAVLKALERTDD